MIQDGLGVESRGGLEYPGAKILVVEDEQDLRDLLGIYLDRQGFSVETCASGAAMWKSLREFGGDLVVLDVRLEDADGFQLARQLRETSDIGIVLLTALGEVSDRVVGLEIGADDYVTKPCELRELAARIRSVLRRRIGSPMHETGHGGTEPRSDFWQLDSERRLLISPEMAEIGLTNAEFALFKVFASRADQVLSREVIMHELRGDRSSTWEKGLEVQVGRLRKKIEANPKSPTVLRTVHGLGYVLSTDVRIL